MGALRLLGASGPAIEVTAERTVVGRDPASQLVVEDRSVSRAHAVIEKRGDAWFVIDKGSSNGTFLNGQRVAESVLKDGQELRFGHAAYQVEIEAPEQSATILLPQPPVAQAPATILVQAPERAAVPVPAAGPAAPPPQLAQASPVAGRGAAAARPAAAAPRAAQPVQPAAAKYDPADLPAAHPVVVSEALDSLIIKAPAGGLLAGAPPRAHVGINPITKLFGSLAIVLFATLLFFVIGAGKSRTEIEKLSQASDLVAARRDAETYKSTGSLVKDGVLINRRLAVCNLGSQSMRIVWLGAVHVGATPTNPGDPQSPKEYRPQAFNSAFCGQEFNFVLAPGAKTAFNLSSSANARCQWDGTAAFFALAAQPSEGSESETVEPVWFSGVPGGEEACVQLGKAQ